MKKKICFWTPRGVCACLLSISLQTTPFGSFPDLFALIHFLATCFSWQKKKTKFVRVITKFYVKVTTIFVA